MVRRKLSEEQRDTIKELRSQGLTNSELAKQFGVSTQTIIRVCRPEFYEKTLLSNKRYRENNAQQIYQTRKENAKSYKLDFHRVNDAQIISQLEKQGSIQGYIRDLIANDIKK